MEPINGEKHGSFIGGLFFGMLAALMILMCSIPGLDFGDFWIMLSKGSEVRCNPAAKTNQALCVIFK